MGGPTSFERGTGGRGTANRHSSPFDRSVMASVVVWSAIGDEAIPDALADGLEYQDRFEAALGDGDF